MSGELGHERLSVSVAGGKYTVQTGDAGNLRALRYGEPWRDCCGDNLILALAQEVDNLRHKLDEIRVWCDE